MYHWLSTEMYAVYWQSLLNIYCLLATRATYSHLTGTGRFLLVDSCWATQLVVKYQTYLIRTVGRLYGELADDFWKSADDDTGESAVESADSGLELAVSTTDSTANSAKVGVWVRALNVNPVYP